MKIINVGYSSTNYYLLDNDKVKLLVDAGWPFMSCEARISG